MRYIPKRGDIIWLDFDPAAGHEQAHHRPALVLSEEIFNAKIGLAMVVPITSKVRGHGFEVILDKTQTQGAVLCHQAKTVDFNARCCSLIEVAPASTLVDVLAKVRVILS